ncbi:MAG: ATP-binding protein [Bacteroidota bacterium]
MKDNKVLILYGPRQAGKTTILHMLSDVLDTKIRWWNGDEPDHRIQLENSTSTGLRSMIGDAKLIFIDEAQRIKNIGLCIKLIVDNVKGVKVIATGSSSFELANKISEPLTGRKWEFGLFPFSHKEMSEHTSNEDEKRLLERRMIFGYYPDVVNNPGDESNLLRELAGSYLYKDILTWERIHKPEKLERLVRALALQIGSEVSYNELGQICGIDNETVEKYISLLEKAYIVFRLNSFSRNLRNELKKSRKIYFYDNGIRNAVISQFSPLELRSDTGQLWENFLISGRLKVLSNTGVHLNRYFWRTTAQQEIDLIEESEGKISAFEFKWNPQKKVLFSRTFTNAYSQADTLVVSRRNYGQFLSKPL